MLYKNFVGVVPNKRTLVVREPGIPSGVGSLESGNSLLVFSKVGFVFSQISS